MVKGVDSKSTAARRSGSNPDGSVGNKHFVLLCIWPSQSVCIRIIRIVSNAVLQCETAALDTEPYHAAAVAAFSIDQATVPGNTNNIPKSGYICEA